MKLIMAANPDASVHKHNLVSAEKLAGLETDALGAAPTKLI